MAEVAKALSSAEKNEIRDLVLAIVRALVDKPEEVAVALVEGQSSIVLELTTARADIGKVIGKQGAHADAIRRLVHAVGCKHRRHYLLEIIEDY